jgi:hypothetical protein
MKKPWPTGADVGRVLRVGDKQASQWAADGHIAYEGDWHSRINPLLQKGAHNFDEPPTLQELLDKRIELLTTEEALAKLPRIGTAGTLVRYVQQGYLAAIKLPLNWRFDSESVEWLMRAFARLPETHLMRGQVLQVLGISPKTLVSTLILPGKLRRIRGYGSEHPRALLIEKASLLEVLRELLPAWIPAEEWLAVRLATSSKLWTPTQVQEALQIDSDGFAELRHLRQLPYIQTPGSVGTVAGKKPSPWYLTPPESVMAYLSRQPDITISGLATAFFADVPTVTQWSREGLLTCRLHPHRNTRLKAACVIGIMARSLGSKIARRWFEGDAPIRMVDEAWAAQRLQRSVPEIVTLAKSGQLAGLERPDGSWRFSHSTVTMARKRQLKAARGA